ncbi:hypothetical protein G6F70_004126 [Rhizopus microsporus]|nr:hypothetical protein G6F71_003074 [Rhizopus microsporus]KAG1200343.1 hypothetical protein G6F70_004126 [Rhizopus microsporus]KAG1211966.1 hypothetical protein G6F69_004110 [Rhizopus microsporus]
MQNQLPERFERLNPVERQAIQNLRMIANLRELHQLVLQTLPAVQNVLKQNDLTEEARLEQIQILTVTRERIAVAENQLRIMQPIEQQSQNTLNTNEAARECMNIDILIRRLNLMENQHARLFQQSEIITQQIRLVDSNLQTQGLSKITNETFWSHLYRKVALDPNNLNAAIRFSPHILNNFNDFEATRREPGLDTYRYAIPTLDPLHRILSNAYGSTIVQNVTMHLLNTKLWIMRIFKGYFLQQQQQPQQRQQQQRQIRLPIIDYGYATNHPLKFIRLSYRLLQAASSLPDAPIKLWSLLPQATHSMVHVPLSGIPTLCTLFQRAHQNGHPIPRFIIPNGNFFRLADFDRFYFGHENKIHLWITVFNIGKLDTGVLANPATSHLAYSMKTDGHMISILFGKTSVEFVPQAKNDLIRQKRNTDFTNRTKGLYPLYKEPTVITANDRIIGIDPGVRDILYAIDCDADEPVDKRSTKEHTFAYSKHKGYAYSNRKMPKTMLLVLYLAKPQ